MANTLSGHCRLLPIGAMEEVKEGKDYHFPTEEESILKRWQEIDAFKTQLKLTEGKPEYSFYDGPPFATGLPHYGHLLAGTLKVCVPHHSHRSHRAHRCAQGACPPPGATCMPPPPPCGGRHSRGWRQALAMRQQSSSFATQYASRQLADGRCLPSACAPLAARSANRGATHTAARCRTL